MKVIFLEDVPKVARAGEMKEVADGYGRNFLIPRKLAMLADVQATAIAQAQLKKRAHLQVKTEAEMKEVGDQLEGIEVTLKARAGAKDRLYGSITSADIAEELSNSSGLVVDKRKIELEEPIRQTGSYEIVIRLSKDILPRIRITVAAEEAEESKQSGERKKAQEGGKKVRKKEKMVEEKDAEEGVKEKAEKEEEEKS